MSVPGAENPEKVRNIVRGEGSLEGFRDLYGELIWGVPGVRWEVGGVGGWKGDGEGSLVVGRHTKTRGG
jgi:translocator assembly and maintenance protein 41